MKNIPKKTQTVAPAYLDTRGAAAYLHCSPKHIIDLHDKGVLKHYKLSPRCVRYKIADLENYMAQFRA